MRSPWIEALNSIKRPVFPEILLLYAIGTLWLLLDTPPIYQGAGFLLLLANLGATVATIFRPRHIATAITVLILMAFATGLMQFNYIPSLTLWMLLLVRLVLSPLRESMLLTFITLTTTIVVSLSVNLLLPALVFSNQQQTILDIVCLSIAVMIMGYHLWHLIMLVSDLRHQLAQQQQRTQTLVNVTNRLARFLPPQVWQPIIQNQSYVEVASQRRKLTILFSDIVGFTDLSDNISADHLANILNTYLNRMTQITLKHGATLDKFLGDGLLCYFGDFGNSDERADAVRCANMAIEMRWEMQRLRKQWRLLGFEGLYIRIGINTGYCYVGNFGSSNRMTYTVIGKEANLAARLETAAQKNQILLSESTYHLICHEHNCQPTGELLLKGINKSVKTWQLLDPSYTEDAVANWVDFQLPGFNLHLNFQDIRNYDRRSITSYLNQAMDLVEKKSEEKMTDDKDTADH